MSTVRPAEPGRPADGYQAGASFALDESKLRPPWIRPGIVSRGGLVEEVLGRPGSPVVCLVAPPGYGKTTLLAQWAEWRGRVAWVGLDRRDNDPTVLLTYVAAALDRVEPIDPDVLHSLTLPGSVAAVVVAQLVGVLSAATEPVALVLDQLEALEAGPSLDAIAELAVQCSVRPHRGMQLVVASRVTAPLPMARLRARGAVVELGIAELAMDRREAQLLLEGAGLGRVEAEGQAARLLQHTEGWPVGLYLAALSLTAGAPADDQGVEFTGEDRFVADYLWSELLSGLSATTISLLTRVAVLDRMCGPLCDATLKTTGSSEVLETLAASNLLLVPLDRRRHWYRFHQLFRELLGAELQRREPDLVPLLHQRASQWCETNDLIEAAIGHAQAAGDADRVARLIAGLIQPTTAAGRVETVRRWLAWFEDRGLVERFPIVAVRGAWVYALWGQPAATERWADAAGRESIEGPLPDIGTMHSEQALLRALLCRSGVERMRADAEAGLAGLGPRGQLQAAGLLLVAISYLLEGETDRADPILARTVNLGVEIGALPAVAIALAERCVVSIQRKDWDQAATFADEAFRTVTIGRLDNYVPVTLVYAMLAQTAAHQGELPRAHRQLARAARLRPRLSYTTPYLGVQTLLELGRAYLLIGEPSGVRVILQEANDILLLRPDLATLPEQAEELRNRLDSVRETAVGTTSLTRAELRVLPLLSTHFSFREIGERLYVSQNTVKKHASSIYGKLGVSSRSQAVKRAEAVGLSG